MAAGVFEASRVALDDVMSGNTINPDATDLAKIKSLFDDVFNLAVDEMRWPKGKNQPRQYDDETAEQIKAVGIAAYQFDVNPDAPPPMVNLRQPGDRADMAEQLRAVAQRIKVVIEADVLTDATGGTSSLTRMDWAIRLSLAEVVRQGIIDEEVATSIAEQAARSYRWAKKRL